MAYGRFEGIIPQGSYGAGAVIVWDTGTYRNLSDKQVDEGLREGHIKIWIEGRKLKGGYALTRTGMKPENWLLVKINDEAAKTRYDITASEPNSVLSGLAIDDLAA